MLQAQAWQTTNPFPDRINKKERQHEIWPLGLLRILHFCMRVQTYQLKWIIWLFHLMNSWWVCSCLKNWQDRSAKHISLILQRHPLDCNYGSALSQESSIHSYHDTVGNTVCNIFTRHSAADSVKGRGEEERGSGQRREDKRRVWVWLWSSHKNCPLTAKNKYRRMHAHTVHAHEQAHTHTAAIKFCHLKP